VISMKTVSDSEAIAVTVGAKRDWRPRSRAAAASGHIPSETPRPREITGEGKELFSESITVQDAMHGTSPITSRRKVGDVPRPHCGPVSSRPSASPRYAHPARFRMVGKYTCRGSQKFLAAFLKRSRRVQAPERREILPRAANPPALRSRVRRR